jgi:hypothetical protein
MDTQTTTPPRQPAEGGLTRSDLFEDYSLESLCAEIYERRDWHRLNERERVLVARLEKSGHLTTNIPDNGFVGKASPIPCRIHSSNDQVEARQ